ncbi:MAG: hypothetical protein JSS20_10010 [Proteobacteria bacterium]|nr:hypothetical protein [Pseudomonadota bacterium]
MSRLVSLTTDGSIKRGSIRDSDVARLRVAYRDAASLTTEDAEALFDLHVASPIQDPSWGPFLVEAVTEFIVNQAAPEGYVVAENARWLKEHIGRYGRVETTAELTLLVHVIETARWTPPSLAAFALAQIGAAVVSGTGPLRAINAAPAGTITPSEVDLAARIIAAYGGEAGIPVTRAEAEELLAINRAIAPGHSSPAWSALFVRAIGSAVLSALGHDVPARRDIVSLSPSADAALDVLSALIGDRHQTAASAAADARLIGLARIWSTIPMQSPEERALARLARQRLEIVTNEVIEEATDVWLMSRLGEAPEADDNEIALIAYIAREATQLPPALAEFAATRSAA